MPGERDARARPSGTTLLVGLEDAVVAAAMREMEAAGWRVAASGAVPDDPWCLGTVALVVVESVDDGVALDPYVELARRRTRQVLATRSWELGCLLFDSLHRLGDATMVTPELVPATWHLDAVQLELLVALSGGASVAEAAAQAHLSERSAARQLARARELLGVPTTAAAATVVGTRQSSVAPPAAT